MPKTDQNATKTPDVPALPDLQADLDAQAAQEAQARADEEQLEREKASVLQREKAAVGVNIVATLPTEPELLAAAAQARADDAASRDEAGTAYYISKVGHMIDPDTGKEFNTDKGTKSHLTSWLDFQIKHDKIELEKD